MNIKKLIEELDKLSEDELVDDFEDVEVSDEHLEEPKNTTEELDAKTKISRALDVLKGAIEDFKNATIEEVDLVSDADLTVTFEKLDGVAAEIEQVITGKTEAPVEEAPEELEPAEDSEDAEDDDDLEEIDFDDEASIDLFGDEEDDDTEETEEE